MYTEIVVINIPSEIKNHIHKFYKIKGNIDFKIGENIIINDYVFGKRDCGTVHEERGVKFIVNSHGRIGNDINIKGKIINIEYILYNKYYINVIPLLNNEYKRIYIEFTEETIDKIKKLVSINNNIVEKQIEFE